MQYLDFVNRLAVATLGDQPGSILDATLAENAGFVAILPQAIDYSEQRLYRELNLEATSIRNVNYNLTAGSRDLTLVAGTFVTVDRVSVITPAGSAPPNAGQRNPLMRTSWDFLDMTYSTGGTLGLPQFYALQDSNTIAVGPIPGAGYQVEIIGTIRPAPLSATNASTVLSTAYPDLLFTAAMVFMSGYMRNYGAAVDDPQMGTTWEGQFKTLLQSALQEEQTKKMGGN